MNSTRININDVELKTLEEVVDENKENNIIPNKAIIVNNVVFPVEANFFNLGSITKNISCGKVITNLNLFIKQNTDNSIIICDFSEIESVSESFCKEWAKLLLNTKNKIISINMNPQVTATFGAFVLSEDNFIQIEDVEE